MALQPRGWLSRGGGLTDRLLSVPQGGGEVPGLAGHHQIRTPRNVRAQEEGAS
jgi:hypothetical protein